MKIDQIHPFDIFGVPPKNRLEQWACDMQKARSFHMGLCVQPIRNHGNITDWTTSESIGKGVSVDRLLDVNETIGHGYRHNKKTFYIFRIKGIDIGPWDIYRLHSKYGELPYSLREDFDTAIWWIFRHCLHHNVPLLKEKGINCVSWVNLLASDIGYNLIPKYEYAIESTIERSPLIELEGIVRG